MRFDADMPLKEELLGNEKILIYDPSEAVVKNRYKSANPNGLSAAIFPFISYGAIPAYQGSGRLGDSGIYSSSNGIRFDEEVYFDSSAKFEYDVEFKGTAKFDDGVTFNNEIDFSNSTYVRFNGSTSFYNGAEFSNKVQFNGPATFNATVTFGNTIFGTSANFSSYVSAGEALAVGSSRGGSFKVSGESSFNGRLTSYGVAEFSANVSFENRVDFNDVIFGTTAYFSSFATIAGGLEVGNMSGSFQVFGESTFDGKVYVNAGTDFSGKVEFNNMVFFNSIIPLSPLSDSTRLVGLQTSGQSYSITMGQLKTYLGL